MGGKRATTQFMLVYDHDDDPPPDEVSRVKASLHGLDVEDLVPGTLRVKGSAARVTAAAKGLGANWVVEPEARVSIAPPRATRLRPLP